MPIRPTTPRRTSQPPRRRLRWLTTLGVLLCICTLLVAGVLVRLGVSPTDAWQALRNRQTMELVRYAELRLMGHPKLEGVLLPVLAVMRDRLERAPQTPFVGLGKGQRAMGLSLARFDEAGMPQSALPLATIDRGRPATRMLFSVAELAEALGRAEPGDVLELAPGTYQLAQTLQTGNGGRPEMPITLRAARPGSVTLAVATTQGLVVSKPYWVFENLDWRGACKDDGDCEHAYHVVGAARGTVIRNNSIADFNAHVKVNGESGQWPDDGLLQFNTITNSRARSTGNPVTPVDLVGANGWQFLDNHVEHFVKGSGNGLSYGMFMKGAGARGRIERNLVVCTREGISQPGLRVGISMGGGGTGTAYCRDKRCAAEHSDGVIANNVIAHCNDVGIDVNRSVRILVAHNTLVNTLGILARGTPSELDALNNLVEGGLHTRQGAVLRDSGNQVASRLDDLLQRPDSLDLRWLEFPSSLPRNPLVPRDFCGHQRPLASPPGATLAATCVAAPGAGV